jgi:hypothetical protein
MALFQISNQTTNINPKANWDTGNIRNSIVVKPPPRPKDYTTCDIVISLTGSTTLLNRCRFRTEAWHGAQPGRDLLVGNFLFS